MTSKWDLQPRFRQKPVKAKPTKPKGDLCRVLPPRLARTPGIYEFLISKIDSARLERYHLVMAYRRKCSEIADLLLNEKFD
ncbi:hypothetical protein [Providencia phage PSTCR5]|uniref:Uncharacterized protein n=1 Tax=Providencia phage PSTCR5 TaxID=2783547 RepID=A0A873WND8_9CAUD|nr:hypothetical protein KNV68_gp001 [Providencia phage PSTCR5]QPB12099.1 hypothetical protein [Providencia phage PSTCR5]